MIKSALFAISRSGPTSTSYARRTRFNSHSGSTCIKSLSTAAASNADASASTDTDVSDVPSLYCWGASKKGSIPVKEVLEDGKSGDGGGGGLLNRSKDVIIDHPRKIDFDDAFQVGQDAKTTTTIRDVVCGPESTAIILSNNTAYTFGSNTNGQLGHGNTADVLIPKQLSPPDSTPLRHDQISKISLGANFSAIIDTNGDLYTCGYNGSVMKEGMGCLGHGYFPEEYLHVPTLIESLVEDGCKADQVAVGNSHMTVLTTDGEVLTCGSAQSGRVGNIDVEDQLFLEPVELLESEKDIFQIASGKDFSLALTKKEGIIYAWGKNDKGQCGTGGGLGVEMYAMEPMPVPVEGLLEGRKIVAISAGHSHAAAVTDLGELFVWGQGQDLMPELVPTSTKIIDVACGKGYTIAIGEDGKIYSLGKGKGVLGLASAKSAASPTVVEGMLGKNISKLSAGWNHVACIAQNQE